MTATSDAKSLELTVTNFGPIAEAKVELRPLTVFVGPSNTGKSYMAALIYALHRLFGGNPQDSDRLASPKAVHRDRLAASLKGYDLSTNDISQISMWLRESIFHTETSKNPSDVLLELQDSVSEMVRSLLRDGGQLIQDLDEELSRCFGVESRLLVHHPMRGNTSCSVGREEILGRQGADRFKYRFAISEAGVDLEACIPDTIPLPIGKEFGGVLDPWRWLLAEFQSEEERRKDAAVTALTVIATDCVFAMVDPLSRRAFYLPANRAGVMHAHQVVVRALIAGASRTAIRPTTSMPALSGVLGDFLEQLVALTSLTQQEDGNLDEVAQQLEHSLLQGAVRVEKTEIDYPSFVYQPNGWDRELPLMNVSSMVSELVPVVLYFRHVVQPGDLLIIEEPEAHLHPEMQAVFTRQLVAAVQSGVRILITTHSEWILEELANLVRLSELPKERRVGIENADIALSPDQLGAWFFEPNEEEGGSVVREISLDEESATFPAGFGLVTESLYNRWVEISSRIQEE